MKSHVVCFINELLLLASAAIKENMLQYFICVCVCVCVRHPQLLQEVQVGQSAAGQRRQVVHAEITAQRERERK